MIALLLALLVGITVPSRLDDAERAYREGRFEAAFALWEQALREEAAPASLLLYNMGNCAFRLGRHAEAVLCYRRAQLRLPRDGRVEFNLRLAQERLGIDAPGAESFGDLLSAFPNALTPGELLLLAISLQGLGLTGFLLLQRSPLRTGALLLVFLGLAGGIRLVQTRCCPGPPAGVVLAGRLALRAEPHAALPILFELDAGAGVRVEELSDRWARVAHAQGSGWTERAGVGLVD